MVKLCNWLIAIFLISSIQLSARSFDSADGKKKVNGELTGFVGAKVKIKRQKDGKIIVVPISFFSQKDRIYFLAEKARLKELKRYYQLTSKDGKNVLIARVISFPNDMVVLKKKKGGKKITVPISKFSGETQKKLVQIRNGRYKGPASPGSMPMQPASKRESPKTSPGMPGMPLSKREPKKTSPGGMPGMPLSKKKSSSKQTSAAQEKEKAPSKKERKEFFAKKYGVDVNIITDDILADYEKFEKKFGAYAKSSDDYEHEYDDSARGKFEQIYDKYSTLGAIAGFLAGVVFIIIMFGLSIINYFLTSKIMSIRAATFKDAIRMACVVYAIQLGADVLFAILELINLNVSFFLSNLVFGWSYYIGYNRVYGDSEEGCFTLFLFCLISGVLLIVEIVLIMVVIVFIAFALFAGAMGLSGAALMISQLMPVVC
ncbi:MAG: hypothetical protein MJH11_00500 [Lentisphaeria bacterium]|nr:hypothetical protein [Lentisphaeria bacterium]